MSYRKFKADRLFTGTALTPEGQVLITDETGTIEAMLPENEAGDEIQYVEGILSPGLINCHCHLELSHMKGLIPAGTGMVPFLLAVMLNRNVPPETIETAIIAAETQMLETGIVAVGDICNTDHTVPQKMKKRLFYRNFAEVAGFIPETATSRFISAQRLCKQLMVTGPSEIVPHAPYSVSRELFQLIANQQEAGVVTMHNQESDAENDFFLTGDSELRKIYETIGADIGFFRPTGKTSIQTVLPWLSEKAKLLLVHNVKTSSEDIRVIQDREGGKELTYFCLCPNANLYINKNLPPVGKLMENNCRIVLGTDSLASNSGLSILEEMKTINKAFPEITIEKLLCWATSNGADALGISDTFGNFRKGSRPGIIAINNWDTHRIL
jgi:cytosine/adenosine deaminase-related metal-dependent hydrolase